jgi:hypothetical protein
MALPVRWDRWVKRSRCKGSLHSFLWERGCGRSSPGANGQDVPHKLGMTSSFDIEQDCQRFASESPDIFSLSPLNFS